MGGCRKRFFARSFLNKGNGNIYNIYKLWNWNNIYYLEDTHRMQEIEIVFPRYCRLKDIFLTPNLWRGSLEPHNGGR